VLNANLATAHSHADRHDNAKGRPARGGTFPYAYARAYACCAYAAACVVVRWDASARPRPQLISGRKYATAIARLACIRGTWPGL
jgi:hypothetical protein